MNPECDLILRKKKRNAKKLLTVSGDLKPMNAPDSTMTSFILLDDQSGTKKPYSIDWKLRAIDTHPCADAVPDGQATADHWPPPGKSDDERIFVGTLRPLYAQELQKNLLSHLGRPSIPVGPALAMAATCKLFVAKSEDANPVEVKVLNDDQPHCWIIHDVKPKPSIIFTRRFASALMSAIQGLDHSYAEFEVNVLAEDFQAKLSGTGAQLGQRIFGIDIVVDDPKASTSKSTHWLVVNAHDKAPAENAGNNQ